MTRETPANPPLSFVYNIGDNWFHNGIRWIPYRVVTESAYKHGANRRIINEVLQQVVVADQVTENPNCLLLGFDAAGRLWELVGALRENDGVFVIWHMQRCRRKYLKLLPGYAGKGDSDD
jgi:hypothetical protein